MSNLRSDNEVIFEYNRLQAIEDGIFIDITHYAWEVGIQYPVAITSNLYNTLLKTEEGMNEERLHELLNSFKKAARVCKLGEDMVEFECNWGEKVRIWACVEGQSSVDPSPAINIMLPEDY